MTDFPSSPVTETPMSLIDKRLADLREANDVFRTHSWDRSSAIARNEREISWLRDLRSALVLCGHAQTPADTHDATYLRGWNEGVEQAAEVADGMAAAQRATNEKYPHHATAYATWRNAVFCYQDVAKQIRALSDTSTIGNSK